MIRFYVAPQIGSGTDEDPYRSLLNDFVNVAAGEWFDEIDNPARRISLTCVHASQTTHDNIAADSRVIVVSNAIAEANIDTYLNALISNVPNVDTLKAKLENVGVSTSWYSQDNTVKDGLRYLIRIFVLAQLADGAGNGNLKSFIAQNLDTTINQVPAAVRNAVNTWMQGKGLATGWITSTTTVRQVLHFVVTNLGFGTFKMSNEGF